MCARRTRRVPQQSLSHPQQRPRSRMLLKSLHIPQRCCRTCARALFNHTITRTRTRPQFLSAAMVKIHIIYYSTYAALATNNFKLQQTTAIGLSLMPAHVFLTATGTSSRWPKKWPPPSPCVPPFHFRFESPAVAPVHHVSSHSPCIRLRATRLPFTRYCVLLNTSLSSIGL